MFRYEDKVEKYEDQLDELMKEQRAFTRTRGNTESLYAQELNDQIDKAQKRVNMMRKKLSIPLCECVTYCDIKCDL